jgi:hypothetical protein
MYFLRKLMKDALLQNEGVNHYSGSRDPTQEKIRNSKMVVKT